MYREKEAKAHEDDIAAAIDSHFNLQFEILSEKMEIADENKPTSVKFLSNIDRLRKEVENAGYFSHLKRALKILAQRARTKNYFFEKCRSVYESVWGSKLKRIDGWQKELQIFKLIPAIGVDLPANRNMYRNGFTKQLALLGRQNMGALTLYYDEQIRNCLHQSKEAVGAASVDILNKCGTEIVKNWPMVCFHKYISLILQASVTNFCTIISGFV